MTANLLRQWRDPKAQPRLPERLIQSGNRGQGSPSDSEAINFDAVYVYVRRIVGKDGLLIQSDEKIAAGPCHAA